MYLPDFAEMSAGKFCRSVFTTGRSRCIIAVGNNSSFAKEKNI